MLTRNVFKVIFVFCAGLVLAGNSWALPMEDHSVRMIYNGNLPYIMEDLTDNNIYSTFCLEKNNFFTSGQTYKVASVGDYAQGGGLGPDGKDPVSDESKWLYAAYMSNVFDVVANAASKVQNAIWFLEDEYDQGQSDWTALRSYQNSFDASGWKIVAVNISRNGVDNQSQLAGVAPVPEPATMFLMGVGLLGLFGVNRLRSRKV